MQITITIDCIDAARKRLRVTVLELCNLAGVHPATYRRAVAGSCHTRSENLNALARALTNIARKQKKIVRELTRDNDRSAA